MPPEDNADGPPSLDESQTYNRTGETIPPPDPKMVEVVEMISQANKAQHEGALEKMGCSQEMIEFIRNLDGLANSSAEFMAISLHTTQRSHYVQIIGLAQLSQKEMKDLMAKPGEPGYIADDYIRIARTRNYTDMVNAAGKAYELMLTGTQAMIRMSLQANGKPSAPVPNKKPAWRKVAASDRHAKT